MSTSQQWDVIVIGSGAGGGAVARRLSEAGMHVLVLEKGPRYQPDDYRHDELAHVHRPFFTPDLMRDPHLVTTRKTTTPVRMKLGWSASCVGGGTEHMGAYLYRFHPYDFDQRSRYGAYQDLVDWPLDYAELEPYYVQAEQLLGVAGDGPALERDYAPRSAPLPLPPLRSHPVTSALEAAIREQGMTPSPTPRAINSQAYAGRPACQYCPRCGNYGCPIEARGTSQAALIKPAQASGRCEVRSQCMVSEITLADAATASGCRYYDHTGAQHQVEAGHIVIACSAVESARLLLLSRSRHYPDGLANRSGQVGRHLQFHGVTLGWAEYDSKHFHQLCQGQAETSPFIGRSVYDYFQLPENVAPLRRGGIIRFASVSADPIGDARSLAASPQGALWGKPLLEKLADYYPRHRRLGYEVFHDFIANPDTYVTLDEQQLDAWGLPVARIQLHVDPHQIQAGQWLAGRAEEVLQQLQPLRIQRGVTGGTVSHLMHGTCRASDDPAGGVVDRDCRTHDVGNLYIADASFMPTNGIAPPTLTIVANALRVADRIAASAGFVVSR